jgi:HSP20 family molecular chaperone IbpA
MTLVSVSSPFDTLLNLQRNIDRSFKTSPALDMGLSGRGAFPPVNVFSEKDGYVVRMEAPGLQLDQLSMESHGRTLMLKGERALKTPEGGSFHRRERKSGHYECTGTAGARKTRSDERGIHAPRTDLCATG